MPRIRGKVVLADKESSSPMAQPRMAGFFPSKELEREGLYVHMFRDDIPLGVVPYRDDEYSAKISGEESEVKRAIILLRSLDNYDRHHVKELVANVVRSLVGTIAYQGLSLIHI